VGWANEQLNRRVQGRKPGSQGKFLMDWIVVSGVVVVVVPSSPTSEKRMAVPPTTAH